MEQIVGYRDPQEGEGTSFSHRAHYFFITRARLRRREAPETLDPVGDAVPRRDLTPRPARAAKEVALGEGEEGMMDLWKWTGQREGTRPRGSVTEPIWAPLGSGRHRLEACATARVAGWHGHLACVLALRNSKGRRRMGEGAARSPRTSGWVMRPGGGRGVRYVSV